MKFRDPLTGFSALAGDPKGEKRSADVIGRDESGFIQLTHYLLAKIVEVSVISGRGGGPLRAHLIARL